MPSYTVVNQVCPGLGKHAENETDTNSSQDGKKDGTFPPKNTRDHDLGRTASEEREYEFQESVELMRQEKKENEVLLETLKLVQGLQVGTLYDHEISLLRESIAQKQDMINNLHSKGLELSHKTKYLELELQDQQDRTKDERERLMQESEAIERSIEGIKEDQQCALQRLKQYQLLYTRTKEDRDDAETQMLRARELVDSSREDLNSLKDCLQNRIKVSQETCERNLNISLAEMKASKAFWKSSLERKKQEIDAIICRYEKARGDRKKEEEEETRMQMHAERIRRERHDEEKKRHQNAVENDLKNARQMHKEQWGLICAAAGLQPDAPASAVMQSYDSLAGLAKDLQSKQGGLDNYSNISEGLVDSEDKFERTAVGVECCNTLSVLERSMHGIESLDREAVRNDAIMTRVEISLLYLQETMAAFFGESSEESVDSAPKEQMLSPSLPRLRRRSSMLALHPRRLSAAQLEHQIEQQNNGKSFPGLVGQQHASKDASRYLPILKSFSEEQLSNYFKKLATIVSSQQSPPFDIKSFIDRSTAHADLPTHHLECLLSKETRVQESLSMCMQPELELSANIKDVHVTSATEDVSVLKIPEFRVNKPVLSREDIKARSWKMKAKLDKQRHHFLA